MLLKSWTKWAGAALLAAAVPAIGAVHAHHQTASTPAKLAVVTPVAGNHAKSAVKTSAKTTTVALKTKTPVKQVASHHGAHKKLVASHKHAPTKLVSHKLKKQ